MGTGVSVLSVLQKGLQGWIRTASTRRTVRREKATVQQRRPLPAAETGRSCWGCGQQDARAAQGTMQPLGAATRVPFQRGSRNPPAPTKDSSIRTGYWSFCFICLEKGTARVDSNSIDPPNSPAGKKPPVQQRRPLPAAETGRSCWGCGQQDARAAQGTMQPLGAATRVPFQRGSRNPPAPTKDSSIRTGYWSFCFICLEKGTARVDSNSIDPPNSPAGKKPPVQQRRPLPAAETGRSCWGCGQQDARAAQGTMQPLGAATRVPFLRGSRNPPAPTKKPQRMQVR